MATKRYTAASLMASIPTTYKTEVKPEGDCFKDVIIQVRRTLPLEDAVRFVKDITMTCIDDDNAEYSPELFDFAMRLYVLMYYANIDLTKDVKKAYTILYDTSLFNQIVPWVNNEQLNALIKSAGERIEHWKSIISSSVAGKVSTIMHKMDEMMSGGAEMMEAIDSDGFKEAIARLTDAGIMDNFTNGLAPEINDSITESITPNDVNVPAELMKGITQQADTTGNNIVYMKK